MRRRSTSRSGTSRRAPRRARTFPRAHTNLAPTPERERAESLREVLDFVAEEPQGGA
jgi:hypothetical protein